MQLVVRSSCRIPLLLAGALCASMIAFASPSATAASFQFSGLVASVDVYSTTAPFTAVVGDTGSGVGSFDSDSAAFPTGPGQTDFPQTGHSLSLSIPGLDLTLPVVSAYTSVDIFATRFGMTATDTGALALSLGVDWVEILFGLVGDPGLLPVGELPTDLSEASWDQRQQVLRGAGARTVPRTLLRAGW